MLSCASLKGIVALSHAPQLSVNCTRRLKDFISLSETVRGGFLSHRCTSNFLTDRSGLSSFVAFGNVRSSDTGYDFLTAREIEVLRLIAAGNANKLIADQLSISEETVKGHVKSILSKLAANDRTHAVTIGLKRVIIEL